MIISLIRTWDDYPPTTLGFVDTGPVPIGALAANHIEAIIYAAWTEFQDTEPQSDNEFVSWLCKQYKWAQVSPVDHEVVLD